MNNEVKQTKDADKKCGGTGKLLQNFCITNNWSIGPEFLDLSQKNFRTYHRISVDIAEFLYDQQLVENFWTYYRISV
jgi:hypothetical protein